MKRNAILTLVAAAALGLALTGCGQQTTQAGYIGADAAKAIALDAAGIAEGAATFSSTDLDSRNGTDYYEVDFTANGQSYEYDIDAVTGVVISSNQSTGGTTQATAGTNTTGATAGTNSTGTTAGTAAVDEAKAKEIALSHAGLSQNQVTFVKCQLDWDDGRQTYDVEFYTTDYKEYDYEIDATTGAVLSYDYDAEGYTPGTSSGTQTITADRAKEIVLAEVPGATTSDIYEFETDRDDGRLEYEGTIYYNGTKYEFSVDGYSGAIRSWEVENGR